ncbi:MAG: CPBP family intramembrane metalloprotease [Gemmataceae bacterium]|nr:CPBP family intramembrane metalloprotease [Gemmataceae bacterium]
MTADQPQYWQATRHPWACVLFVLPLLAIYEVGLYFTATEADAMRNGADAWLRTFLTHLGIEPTYEAPVLLICVLLGWGLIRREGRPTDKVGVWAGMMGESAAYAVLLLGLSQAVWLMLIRADVWLGRPNPRVLLQIAGEIDPDGLDPMWGQLVGYLGAGIYEETLFRLLTYGGLLRLFSWNESKVSLWVILLSAFASALLFAGAHHIGPNGDAFSLYVLTFRMFAGIYFAALYHLRGFGIAVGAHAGYDVLVGLILVP